MQRTVVPTAWLRSASATWVAPGLALSLALSLAVAGPAAAQPNPYNSLTLDWTAPGDDGMSGRASAYDLRYLSVAIAGTDTLGWWNLATQVTGEPVPGVATATDSYTVTGLSQGTTYHFIIRALDEVPNISGFSNVASGTTQSCNAPTSAPGLNAVADTGQVLVSWSGSDPLAVSLKLYRGQGASGTLTLYQTLSPTSSPYLDTSVAAGTTYRYRAAWMGSVCEGPSTSVVTVTTPGTPGSTPGGGGTSTVHAYPNPASGSIRLVIDVAAQSSQAVSVKVYDMNGRWIATLADGSYPPGASELTWARVARDGGLVGPGYYELLGTVGSTRVRERLVLLP